ncbi:hypothetical protein XELAEV_18021458mg [Xenopus laevis]|uniref:Interleukin-4 n=1 Tax=Xenopus laevis TaxID=8355 RepID=A0A974DAE9_XENLA|nr:hypothetical protein XELAEV_18021458mg [Xenopus laevis]
MNKLVRILFALLGLFCLLGANPVTSRTPEEIAFEEIITELIHLNLTNKDTCLVPIPCDNIKNISVEEMSCRTFQSLKQVCESEREKLHAINASLSTLFKKSMECSINRHEQKDLKSVRDDLLRFFRLQLQQLLVKH